jgi:hypothetical protein
MRKPSKRRMKSSKKTFQSLESNENHKLDPAIARIFFLLSKRFQDSKYKTFFMDQVEVLVYKHGIKDRKIMSILENLDLRFDINDLCPTESEREDQKPQMNAIDQQKYWQRKLEKKYTKQNIQNLEKMMMIFRADQLFAPLYRLVSQRIMSHNRNFFVNLRFFAKLAPFRKLHYAVQNKVKSRLRNSFSQILFYVKPNLRLLLLIFVISKVKQKRIVDAYRRIYGFYNAVLIKNPDYKIQEKFPQKKEETKELMENFMEHIQSSKTIEKLQEPDLFNNEIGFGSGIKKKKINKIMNEDLHNMFQKKPAITSQKPFYEDNGKQCSIP